MNLTPSAQAIVLLTCYFSSNADKTLKPLTVAEWRDFALWLKEKKIYPEDLMQSNNKRLLEGFTHKKITSARLLALLNRGNAYGFALEKWQRAGIWIVTRSDKDYPSLLKKQLTTNAPPVLFGLGNRALINNGGLAVVGSRQTSHEDLHFAQTIGAKAATDNITIVSGAARGVDEASMLGAVNNGGTAIGVVAGGLFTAATAKEWRTPLMNNCLLLLSTVYPEARFNIGNAMARNKYIYCLAKAALVVHSGKKGGTISGATENLKKNWVPLWVKPSIDEQAANAELVEMGGSWCAEEAATVDIPALLVEKKQSNTPKNPTLFDQKPQQAKKQTSITAKAEEKTEAEVKTQKPDNRVDFYQLFLDELKTLPVNEIKVDELVEKTQLHKSQINAWLKKAVAEKKLEKLARPVRYRMIKQESLV